MRYYDVFIPDAPAVFARTPNGAIWSSHPYGDDRRDPGAQQVEFQFLEVRPSELFFDQSTLVVHGVSWEQIGQQANLIGKHIQVFGGMKPGLPLATYQSQHKGLLIEGEIYKCWGNWIGTDTSIGVTIITGGQSATGGNDPVAGSGSPSTSSSGGVGGGAAPQTMAEANLIQFNRTGPRGMNRFRNLPVGRSGDSFGDFGGFGGFVDMDFGAATQMFGQDIGSLFGGVGGLVYPINFIHNLQPNIPLSQAIQQTLSTAFPNAKLNINISPLLKLAYQDAGVYQNWTQYAAYIKKLSQSILGTSGYVGVNMSSHSNTINVWDDTNPGGTTEISALDLVGQPTWVDIGLIHVTCVLRGDLYMPMHIHLPQTVINVASGSNFATQRSQLSFTGVFRIDKVMHVGDFRSPDGAQWVTNYECTMLTAEEAGMAQTSANATTVNNTQTGAQPMSTDTTVAPPNDPTVSMTRLRSRAVRKY